MSMDIDIAIVGMACRVPGARTPDEYWQNLVEGRESIVPLTDEELLEAGEPESLISDPDYVKVHAPIPDLKSFDGSFFGFSPRESAILDPQHRHFLETAWEAFENSGHVPGRFPGAIGVFAGSGHHYYFSHHLLARRDLLRDVGFFLLRHTGNDKDFLATRVSYLLDLRGPSLGIQTACSTSLVAVHLAAQSLLNRECDMALAGGATIELPEGRGYRYAEGEILSPDGHCRPFDADSQGTVFGSGCGAVILRRLEDALADGDHIHAILKSTAVNNDGGQKVGYLAPSVEGQVGAIQEAIALAGIDPASVTYIEAHGTGTPVGDPIEVTALAEVYGSSGAPPGSIALGSVKSNIGHLDTAAGIAGLIKVVESLKHGELAPTLHYKSGNPACQFEQTPFAVQASHARWTPSGPRRAAISALGVGGTNAHAILEEAPAATTSESGIPPYSLTLSAKNPEALERAASRLADMLEAQPGTPLWDASWTLQTGREGMRYRLAVPASDAGEAVDKLRDSAALKHVIRQAAQSRPKVTFMFAGGGAQFPGMGRDLYETETAFRDVIDEGLAILAARHGLDLRPLLFPEAGTEEAAAMELERPTRSLPALFLVQAACVALWRSWGIHPDRLIGHSMGEYSAALQAGVLSFEDALRVVLKRGELFERVPPGGMLSVAMAADEVRPLLPPSLAVAAENAPDLCVVSGPEAELQRFHGELEARDIEATRIRIRIAAHSPMLDPILEDWRKFLRTVPFSRPQTPIVSNLTGEELSDEEAIDPEYWVKQLRHSVRFASGVGLLLGDEPSVLLECGPGRILTTLARQHPQRESRHELVTSLRRPGEPGSDRSVTIETLGRLWSVGLDPDWKAFHHGLRRKRVPLPTYPFDRTEHWVARGEPHGSDEFDGPLIKLPEVERWGFEPGWEKAPFMEEGEFPAQVLILGGERELKSRLTAVLSAAGAEVTFVSEGDRFRERSPGHFQLDPERPEHFRDLFRALAKAQRLPGLVIHAWNSESLGRIPNADRAALASVKPLGSLLWLAQAIMLEHGPESVRIAVLTADAQAVGGETVASPLRAMSAAVCGVVGAEGDGLSAHAIDLEWPLPPGPYRERVLRSLVREITSRSEAPSVALRRGERWRPTLIPAPLPSVGGHGDVLRNQGTYLVTGGLGGLGLEVAESLVRRVGARVALNSRRPLPPEDRWDEILADPDAESRLRQQISSVRRLRDQGAEVVLIPGDVSDRREARRVIRGVLDRFGSIHGIFHAAGSLDDSLIGQKTPASVDRVVRPKLQGALALDEATARHQLDCFVLFSSTSAFLGLPGQSDYAPANAFLDAFAHWRGDHRPGVTLAINWSIWKEVGMAARMADAQGVSVEPLAGRRSPLNHHVLDRIVVEGPDELELAGSLAPEDHWVLSEHRFRGGDCVLPGTGYLDLVSAAAKVLFEGAPFALRDVSFAAPLAVADGERREVRVRMTSDDQGQWRFVVRSQPAGRSADWTDHCEGQIESRPDSPGPTVSLPEIRAGLPSPEVRERGEFDSIRLDFGPRWDNLRARSMGEGEAILDLELPAPFHGDLEACALHPALLDLATAGAQDLLGGFQESRHFFVPLAYGEVRVFGPLESQVSSHVRLQNGATAESDVAVYDITLLAPDGRVLLEIDDFTMFQVRDTSSFRARRDDPVARSESSPLSEALKVGILPSEGTEVLFRALSRRSAPQLIVAPAGLAQLLNPPGQQDPDRAHEVRDREESTLELVPPRTPIQEEMVRIAGELLGTDRIGVNEYLVDLGLHSLLAVRYFNRLQRATGRNVPIAALLEAPSIELLSPRFGDDPDEALGTRGPDAESEEPESEVSGSTEVAADPEEPQDEPVRGVYDHIEIPDSEAYILPPEEDPDDFSSLVALKPSGTKAPFFVIHARGGAVLNYQKLTTFVEPDQPIYGLQSLGLDGVTEPLRSIEEMAAHYLRVIREIQPKGPYLLGGGSLGGVVGLEMAHQLRDVGEETSLLAMFDSWGPLAFMDTVQLSTTQHLSGRFDRIVRLLRERGPIRTVREIRRRVGRTLSETGQALAIAWHRLMRRALGRQLPHAIRYQFVEGVNLAALRVYRPRPYPGDVVLFRALDDPDFDPRDPTMGWSETVDGRIKVVDCPGTHGTIMKGPVFGQYLSQELERAHADSQALVDRAGSREALAGVEV
jgi:acyl transferase domain-containing protein/thioesterase domain-containing protein/aryl carrier-like protein